MGKTISKIIGEYVEKNDINGLAEYFMAYVADEMVEEKMDTREKVWKLETEALNKADQVNNPYWIMCYKNLAFALSTLDAFIARSSEGISKLIEGKE